MPNQFILTPFVLDQTSPELESLAKPGWRLNKPPLPNGDAQKRMSALHQPIADFIAETVTRGDRPVSIAGDCCTTLGVMAGLQRAGMEPILIWLDAHGDFNTWETSPSNFIGGMPLAMLVRRGEQTMPEAVGLRPFPEARVILTDARDLDPKEKEALTESDVSHLPNSLSLLDLPLSNAPVYIHFDTDIVNPNDAPAMGYRAAGGPSAKELRSIFRSLTQNANLVAVSMTTWNFKLDTDGRSQKVCIELLNSLID